MRGRCAIVHGNRLRFRHVILSIEGRRAGVRNLAKAVGLMALGGLVLPLSACGGQVISAGNVIVLVSERADAGMDALGGGNLEVVGGCLGASGSVIVWPHGTEVVQDDPVTIDIPDYGRFALGDEVEVAGGYVFAHSSDNVESGEYPVGGVTVPAECAKHDIFLAH
jgi:hypothetical protein